MQPSTGVWRRLRIILEMIKFEHTLFALPLAFAGVLLAHETWPSIRTVLLVLVAMVGARSAAMAFNRVADATLDARNPRTRDRALPTGLISVGLGLAFIAGASLLYFVSAYLLNTLCFVLSFPALAILLLYSYTKRFTTLCHLFLGLALALAPFGGWLAVTGRFDWKAAALSPGVLFWVAGFDVLYACMDVEFDREVGLFSIPATLGRKRALQLSRLLHALAWCCLAGAGLVLGLGVLYFVGIVGVGVLLVYEHLLVKPHDLSRVGTAFFTVNSWVSVVLFLGVLGDKVFSS
ncbi:MAG: UbiA family prenyltransferase [Deltaproteobacteria bacterium]|nr:UbiA family prenyltransferase [Deltaproteobacteria bacterium]